MKCPPGRHPRRELAGRLLVLIYSLKKDGGSGFERRLTIQLDLGSKRIVQARGRYNALRSPLDQRYLRNWAAAAGVAVASF